MGYRKMEWASNKKTLAFYDKYECFSGHWIFNFSDSRAFNFFVSRSVPIGFQLINFLSKIHGFRMKWILICTNLWSFVKKKANHQMMMMTSHLRWVVDQEPKPFLGTTIFLSLRGKEWERGIIWVFEFIVLFSFG